MLEDRLSLLINQLDQISAHCARLEAENRELRDRESQCNVERRALIEKCRTADERLGRLVDKLKSLSPRGEVAS